MLCFNHRRADAVGLCKSCCRGLCGACAREQGKWLVCSQECAAALPVGSASAAAAKPTRRPLREKFRAFAAARRSEGESPAPVAPPASRPSRAGTGGEGAAPETVRRRLRETPPQSPSRRPSRGAALLNTVRGLRVSPREFAVYFIVAAGIAAVGALAIG